MIKSNPHYSLAKLSHLKIGMPIDHLFFPKAVSELADVYAFAVDEGLSVYPVGGGSNTLFGSCYQTVVISDRDLPWRWIQKDNQLILSSNHNINYVLVKAGRIGLGGLGFLAGIPAHIGGLVRMNAGAYGHTIGERVVWVKSVDENGEIMTPACECGFGYRHSDIKGFITEVCLEMEEGDPDFLLNEIRERIDFRRSKQPLNSPNLGCFFKNPSGTSAGRLIDDAGLKGFTLGGAKVSEQHGNFLINTGEGRFEDFMALIRYMQDRVYELTGIQLELEVKVIK